MQIRAKMENIAIHVPRNGVFPTLPTTWLLNSTGKKKNPSSTENPSSYICDIPCYLFISKCFSKWQKREISISNKEEIQANLNPHSSIHVSPLGVYSLFNLMRFVLLSPSNVNAGGDVPKALLPVTRTDHWLALLTHRVEHHWWWNSSVLQLHPLIEILTYGKNLRPVPRLFIFQYFQVTYWLEEKWPCDLKWKPSMAAPNSSSSSSSF